MPRLVTALFYDREGAENAVDALTAAGIPAEDIYLEQEVSPSADIGRKGGEVTRLEQERRFAGLETGLIIGLAVGLLGGLGVGFAGNGIVEVMRANGDSTTPIPVLMAHPMWAALTGALMGMIVGGLIGWIIDSTLNRMGAGPAAPLEETLVTVRTSEGVLDDVYSMLFNARARHLHVAERSGG